MSRGTRPASVAHRVVPEGDLDAEALADEVEHRLLGRGHQHLVDGGLGTEASRRPPAGAASPVSGPGRPTGARSPGRPRWGRAHPPGLRRPAAAGAAAGRRPGATAPCCARRGGGPWRWTSRGRPRPRTRSTGTTTSSKKTSQNSWAPCIVSIGRTVMPALSMSTNSAVIPWCADSAVPVRVEEHAPLRVLGQAGPHLLAVDPPAGVGARGPAREGGEVAPRAGLGEALAPDLVAAQQARHHVGRQRRGRVVDHRGRQHLGHGVDAGLDEVAGREHLAEIGAQEVRAAEAADALGPAHAHEAGVVGQPHHLAELVHLLVERPDALEGGGRAPPRARRASRRRQP